MRAICTLAVAALLLCGSGCARMWGPNARNGIVFYCPGASNFDLGDVPLREGLRSAGYTGEVATFYWTIAPIPIAGAAIDQVARINPKLRARILARHIEHYIDTYPGRRVNVVGLSAGSGVALWAIENLKSGYRVDDVVLLSSSLSSTFDARPALRRIRGSIYVYHSPNDAVLAGPMRLTGTIDGVFNVEPAGIVGLIGPYPADRVVNIPWRPEFEELGYYGGHTDSTSSRFIAGEVAPRIIVDQVAPERPQTSLASQPEQAARRAPLD